MRLCDNGATLTSETLSEDEGGVWERRSIRRAAACSTSSSFRPSSNQLCDTLQEHLSLYHTAQAKQGEEGERERMASGGNRTYDLVLSDDMMPDAGTLLLYSCRARYAGCGPQTLCFTELRPEKASSDLLGRRVDRGGERDGNCEGTKEIR